MAILAATWACARTGESNVTASNFFNLGNRFRDSGRFLEAIEQYRIAIEIDRTHVSAWNNLALVLETDPATRDAAIDAWRQVLVLARASGDSGRAERAQRHLKAIGEGISNAPAGP